MNSCSSQNRKRGFFKIDEGSRQAVEKGRSNLILLRLGDGDELRVSGESQSCSFLLNDKYLVDAATKILISTKSSKKLNETPLEYFDSASTKSHEEPTSGLPLLPNPLGSKFWNQKWKKLVFTKVMQCEGIGRNGRDSALVYSKGDGPSWWRQVEDKIPWREFAGPSKAPANFKGNFSDFLFECILAAYQHHNIDVETHVHDPELGQYESFNTRLFNLHKKVVQEENAEVEQVPVKIEYEDPFDEGYEYGNERVDGFGDNSMLGTFDTAVVPGVKVEPGDEVKINNDRKRTTPHQLPQDLLVNKKICSGVKTKLRESGISGSLFTSQLANFSFDCDSDDDKICQFLDSISLSGLKDLFTEEEVTFDMLFEMNEDNLKDLGVVKYGHRFKIISALKRLR